MTIMSHIEVTATGAHAKVFSVFGMCHRRECLANRCSKLGAVRAYAVHQETQVPRSISTTNRRRFVRRSAARFRQITRKLLTREYAYVYKLKAATRGKNHSIADHTDCIRSTHVRI